MQLLKGSLLKRIGLIGGLVAVLALTTGCNGRSSKTKCLFDSVSPVSSSSTLDFSKGRHNLATIGCSF